MIPIGQVEPNIIVYQGLSQDDRKILESAFSKCQNLDVYLASQNPVKWSATMEAVKNWAEHFFPFQQLQISVVTSEVNSGVPEQPLCEQAELGAKTRWEELKARFLPKAHRDHVMIFVAFENGITEEKISKIKNPQYFEVSAGVANVDRCFVKGSIHVGNRGMEFSSLSIGVTVPKTCVEESKKAKQQKTAGAFLVEQYPGVRSGNNWHQDIGRVNRKDVIKEALSEALSFNTKPFAGKKESKIKIG